MVKCPSCSLSVSEVYPVEMALRERILKYNPGFKINDEMCKACINDLRKKNFGAGEMFLEKDKALHDRKQKLWQSRVPLVRNGQAMMSNKLYSDAAVCYEKYLRVLELTFDCKPGQLSPESLKESAKTAELTVIAGTYWDLLRIYDSNSKYLDRQKHSAVQLAKFINYTPIYPDVLKKAGIFLKQAKHPDVVKMFIAHAKLKRTRCFIATSAFEIPVSVEVQFLRSYRDRILKGSFLGRKFILLYYSVSPTIASFLDHQVWLKPMVRVLLRFVIKCVS